MLLRLNLRRCGFTSMHPHLGGKTNTGRGSVICERRKKVGGTQYPSLIPRYHASSTRDSSSPSLDDLATEYEKTIVGVVEKVSHFIFFFISYHWLVVCCVDDPRMLDD